MTLSPPARPVIRTAFGAQGISDGERFVAEETPVALTYNRTTYAVMMATPADIEDFALGFSLTEGIVGSPGEIEDLEIVAVPDGIEARMWLAADRIEDVERRRRHIAGATGCGMCGLESIAEAARPPAPVSGDVLIEAATLRSAMQALCPLQHLNHITHAVHAAGFWRPDAGLIAVREDVGRHNALDKLAGALARARIPASDGAILLTSRISVELVQKAAAMGVPLISAISAPTALAIRTADAAGITLAGITRSDGFELFTHPRRVMREAAGGPGPTPGSQVFGKLAP